LKFVDHVEISVEGGHGGPGASSFRKEKYVPKGGPDGGMGGRGGHVILEVNSSLQTLLDFKMSPMFKARAGAKGERRNMTGANGIDLIIRVPRGTVVRDADGNDLADLVTEKQQFIVAKGGRGGLGNSSFPTPTNRAPKNAQPGEPGQERQIFLELKMIAEVGLFGLPNAGKSTLLKQCTSSSPRIGAYPFTTLYPNLGVLKWVDREAVLADIPGLIEGASEGRGLGSDFLRHVDRTRLLVHVVALVPDDIEQTLRHYDVICDELKKSKFDLINRPSLIVLNKIDLSNEAFVAQAVTAFLDRGLSVIPISAMARLGIDEFSEQVYFALGRADVAKDI
jgi:GTPase